MKTPLAIPYHHCLQYGFGDILREWLREDSWPNILEPLSKEREIHLLVCSHNENTIEFFEYVDFIHAHRIRWRGKTPNYALLAKRLGCELIRRKKRIQLTNEHKELQGHDRMGIYLSPDEEKEFSELSASPYVVIHPFAGSKTRMPIEPLEYKYLIDKIIKTQGKKVIVIGGTFERDNRLRKIKRKQKEEVFPYKRKGLYNLTNKTSLRLATKLAVSSDCFLGNWSAYLCATWERKTHAIAFLRKGHCNTLSKGKAFSRKWHKDCHAVDSTNNTPREAFDIAIKILEKEIF